jgi:hypothetical protein
MPTLSSVFLSLSQASTAEDAGSSGSADLIVLVLSIAAGVLVLAKAVLDYLQTRVRDLPPQTADTCVIQELTTEPERYDDQKALRDWKLLSVLNVVVSAAFSVLVVWLIGQETLSVGLGLVVLVESVGVTALSIWFLIQLWGKKPQDPVDKCEANLTLKGEHDSIINKSQRALILLQAWRAEGVKVSRSNDSLTLQGGTGPWPKKTRGQKVTIEIRPQRDQWRVNIESATYWPSPWASRKDKRNVRRLIEELLS